MGNNLVHNKDNKKILIIHYPWRVSFVFVLSKCCLYFEGFHRSIHPSIHSLFPYSFLSVSFLHSVSFSLSPSIRHFRSFGSFGFMYLSSPTKRDTKRAWPYSVFPAKLWHWTICFSMWWTVAFVSFWTYCTFNARQNLFSKTSSTQSPAYGGWGCEVNYLNMKFHFQTSDEGISLASRVCCSWRIWESCLYLVKSSLHKGACRNVSITRTHTQLNFYLASVGVLLC